MKYIFSLLFVFLLGITQTSMLVDTVDETKQQTEVSFDTNDLSTEVQAVNLSFAKIFKSEKHLFKRCKLKSLSKCKLNSKFSNLNKKIKSYNKNRETDLQKHLT